MREAITQRGFRADEVAPGSGLGLAIVHDLAETYRGSISLEASPMGTALWNVRAGGLPARAR